MVKVIHCYVERIGEFSLPQILNSIQVNQLIYIQSLINIIQENNWIITIKKAKGKLPLFCGNGERLLPIYSAVPLCPIIRLSSRGTSIVHRCPSSFPYFIPPGHVSPTLYVSLLLFYFRLYIIRFYICSRSLLPSNIHSTVPSYSFPHN